MSLALKTPHIRSYKGYRSGGNCVLDALSRSFVILAAALVVIATPIAALAQPAATAREQLTATVGSRLGIPVRDLPASLFMVGQSLIQERGARSVEEAVQLAVGMQASTGVGSIPSYATRGWNGNDISVMRDGIRQNSASQSSR